MEDRGHESRDGHHELNFIRKYVLSVDHKVIGKQYMTLAAMMALIGGAASYLIRWQLAWPETPVPLMHWVPEPYMYEGVLPPNTYNAMFTMHGTVMVFFVAMPLLLGAFGNFLIPLMIGADDMAFPKLNTLSFWTLFVASCILVSSIFTADGPAAAGWTSYAPLSANPDYTGVYLGQNLWIIAVAVEFASFLIGGINFLTTVLNLRAPGMGLMRMPILVWMQIIAAVVFLLSVGPLVGGAVMLLLDRTMGTGFFRPDRGGDPLLWEHLFWYFGHPEVYVVALPGFGIMLEVLPVFARKPIFGYRMVIWTTLAAGVLSFVVWAHHMFLSGLDPRLVTPFSITTIIISVPFAILVFAMIATIWGGQIWFSAAMLFALGGLTTFIIGGLTGIFLGASAVDIYLHGTYFVVAHFHYTLFPVVFFAGFTGIYYWFPKMFGRLMNETLGKLHFWMTFLCFNGVFLPLFWVGLGGAPRRLYEFTNYAMFNHLQNLHVYATISTIGLLSSQGLFIVNFFYSLFFGKKAGRNPWQANTLEWTVDSPPHHPNFEIPPQVYRDPYEYGVPGFAEDFLPQTAVVVDEPRLDAVS